MLGAVLELIKVQFLSKKVEECTMCKDLEKGRGGFKPYHKAAPYLKSHGGTNPTFDRRGTSPTLPTHPTGRVEC